MKEPNSKDSKSSKDKKLGSSKKDPPTTKKSWTAHFNSFGFYAVLIFLVGGLSSVILIEFVPLKSFTQMFSPTLENQTNVTRPTFAMFTHRKNQNNLSIIRKILGMLGYTEVGLKDDWNLLWGFENPFLELRRTLINLKLHQMTNHMPGLGYVTNKATLSTSGSPFMPPAFKLPKDKEKFLSYAAKHPDKIFVEKNNTHRNVQIKKPQDINLESNSTFVQEFITNPYLVDGYKFDIGIYTVITSVIPLRIYIYTGDVMFRYCQERFHPFDPNVLQKYVVGDAYRPTWEVPSLKKYFNKLGGGMRASFDAYVRDKGQDPSKIWEQAEEVIRYTVLSQIPNMIGQWKSFKPRNFFELIRVDLILDTDLKIHLIEANMSPNLHSNLFKYNYIVFEQVLYNTLQLVGVGSPIKEQHNATRFGNRHIAVTAAKNLASNINECVQHNCDFGCDDEHCRLCIPCLEGLEYDTLARAQREHIHRGDMKRIFPKPIFDVKNYDLAEEIKNLTARDQWMTKWFYHKCLYDKSWCQ